MENHGILQVWMIGDSLVDDPESHAHMVKLSLSLGHVSLGGGANVLVIVDVDFVVLIPLHVGEPFDELGLFHSQNFERTVWLHELSLL